MKNYKKNIYLFILAFLPVFSKPIFSQVSNPGIKRVSISSPNAASLGKYGDIPVSYHTGIPDISVPVYKIQSGNLELPISLSYHASGLKAEEQASWVGAGWTLNAGGMITRTVMGGPDDRGLGGGTFTTKGYYSDYGFDSYIFGTGPVYCDPSGKNGPAYCPTGRAGMPPSNAAPQDTYIQTGIFDGEPDLYFFNFGGYSGKFYFTDDRTPVIEPEQDLHIVPIYTGKDSRGMTGFIITTPEGTKYYFGENQSGGNGTGDEHGGTGAPGVDALELTYNVTSQNPYQGQGAISSWFLNKIESADQQFNITLTYASEIYSDYSIAMYPVPSVKNTNFYAYNYEYDINKNFINGVRLSKIDFANGTVEFGAGDLRKDLSLGMGPDPTHSTHFLDEVENNDESYGARTLKDITIKSDQYCRKFTFSYDYWEDNESELGGWLSSDITTKSIQTDKMRLRLNQIQESSCDDKIIIPPYKFTYCNGLVARKLGFGIDHWGFYNGVKTNKGLIPTYTVMPAEGSVDLPLSVLGADRESHWPMSLGGTLKKITYPTGGYSLFTYEPNTVKTEDIDTSYKIIGNFSVGYDGSKVNNSTTFTTTQSTEYKVSMEQNLDKLSEGATLEIKSSDGKDRHAFTIGTVDAQHFEKVILLSNTTYTSSFYTDNTSGNTNGKGATAKISDLIPIITVTDKNTEAGGIRIKTIVHHDCITAKDQTLSYCYNFDNEKNGFSSGILYSIPVYIQALRSDVWGTVSDKSCSVSGCFSCFNTPTFYYLSPSSLRPMSTSQGNHIGYGEVYVSEKNNGYTEYKYYSNGGVFINKWDIPINDVSVRSVKLDCDWSIPNVPPVPTAFDPMRGQLAYTGYFKDDGTLLKSITYIPTYKPDIITTPAIVSKFYVTSYLAEKDDPTISPSTSSNELGDLELAANPSVKVYTGVIPSGIGTFSEYSLQSWRKTKDYTETITYDNQSHNYVQETNTVEYGSSYHFAPTQSISTSSKKENLVTKFTYSSDFRLQNFAPPDGLGTYNANVASDENYLRNTLPTVAPYPDNSLYYFNRLNIYTNYRYMKAVDRQQYIEFRKKYFTDPTSKASYIAKHADAEKNADALLQPILRLQDESINLPLETVHIRGDKVTAAEWTNYGAATDDGNHMYPLSVQRLKLKAPLPDFIPAFVRPDNTTIEKDERYDRTPEMTLQYEKGNITEMTPRNGVTTSYIWGYTNVLPIVKAEGIDYRTLKDAYDNSGGDATQMRKQPVLSKALINTYTYIPLAGTTLQTDYSGRGSYYEYDALGRLTLTRDQDQNILKRFSYSYPSEPIPCAEIIPSCLPVSIASTTLADATASESYQQTIPLEGTPPFTLNNVNAPYWLSVTLNESNIVVAGTPPTGNISQAFSFDVSNYCDGDGLNDFPFTGTIAVKPAPCRPVNITPTSLPAGMQSTAYSQTIPVTGTPPFVLSQVIKPNWMTIAVTDYSVILSGTPSSAATDAPVSFNLDNCGGTSTSQYSATLDVANGGLNGTTYASVSNNLDNVNGAFTVAGGQFTGKVHLKIDCFGATSSSYAIEIKVVITGSDNVNLPAYTLSKSTSTTSGISDHSDTDITLAPGTYTFKVTFTHGDDSESGYFSIGDQ